MDSAKKQTQFFKGISFCIIFILWGSAIALFIYDYRLLSVASSTLSLLFFLYLTNLRTKSLLMFGKKTPITSLSAGTIQPLAVTPENELKTPTDNIELRQQRCTIIAKNASFTGDIEDSGDIQIYGKIIGNVNIKEGAIRVMSTGYVQGELSAPEIIIDGNVSGRCFAETIDILEHGTLRGITCCRNFSIKRGGTFIGQSEEWIQKEVTQVEKGANGKQLEPQAKVEAPSESQLYIFQSNEEKLQADKKKDKNKKEEKIA